MYIYMSLHHSSELPASVVIYSCLINANEVRRASYKGGGDFYEVPNPKMSGAIYRDLKLELVSKNSLEGKGDGMPIKLTCALYWAWPHAPPTSYDAKS